MVSDPPVMLSASRMYSLRILVDPFERVTVIVALGRSRMTVSFWPDVGPLPVAPGKRFVGKGAVATGATCPAPVTGATTGSPLFQFLPAVPSPHVSDQSPLLSFIQTAGIS